MWSRSRVEYQTPMNRALAIYARRKTEQSVDAGKRAGHDQGVPGLVPNLDEV